MDINPSINDFYPIERGPTPAELIAEARDLFDWLDMNTVEDALLCFFENGEADEIAFGGGTTTVRVKNWLLYIQKNGIRQSICFETPESASRAMDDF